MDVTALKRKRYVYLFASAASFLVLGLVYAWSLFATPLATIYGWELSAVKVTFTICMAAFCMGGLIGAQVLKRLGVRGAILLSATLLVCGFAGTALLAPQGIWALYLCYGVLIGCGTGLGYNVAIATVTLWFPDRTGFASGVMFMGFGLGSLTLGTLANTIIATAGLAIALTVVAITAGVVMTCLALLLKRAPDNIGELLGVEKKAEAVADEEADRRRLFRDPAFYIYYLWASILLGAGVLVIGTSKLGALELKRGLRHDARGHHPHRQRGGWAYHGCHLRQEGPAVLDDSGRSGVLRVLHDDCLLLLGQCRHALCRGVPDSGDILWKRGAPCHGLRS